MLRAQAPNGAGTRNRDLLDRGARSLPARRATAFPTPRQAAPVPGDALRRTVSSAEAIQRRTVQAVRRQRVPAMRRRRGRPSAINSESGGSEGHVDLQSRAVVNEVASSFVAAPRHGSSSRRHSGPLRGIRGLPLACSSRRQAMTSTSFVARKWPCTVLATEPPHVPDDFEPVEKIDRTVRGLRRDRRASIHGERLSGDAPPCERGRRRSSARSSRSLSAAFVEPGVPRPEPGLARGRSSNG